MAFTQDPIGHASELVQQGRLPEAREALRRVLETAPSNPEAWHLAGMVEVLSGAPAAGVPLLRRCVELAPAVAFAWSNLGVAYNASADFTRALACFEKALALAPGVAATLKGQGIALGHLGRHGEAVESLRRALQREPKDLELHRELGLAAMRAGDAALAERVLRKALQLAPADPHVHNELGVALEALGRGDDALAAYDRAIALDPAYVEALENRAAAKAGLRRFADALADYEAVEALSPGRRHNAGHRLQAKLGLCDWSGYDALVAQVAAGLAAGRAEAQPFPLCSVPIAPFARRACAEMYARDIAGATPVARAMPGPYRHERLRVGYFSADFRDHPVGHLVAPLAESHDRSRVEVFAYSWGGDGADATRRRLAGAFDRFEDVRRSAPASIAALARGHGLDVAIDLMGHTSGARTAIFMHGAAPVQAQFLGFPGTTGADCIDYVVADEVVIPAEHRAHYTERVALLPGPALVAERNRAIDPVPTRAALGLPAEAFVFCCFCTRAKVTPDAFDAWMRIVSAIEGSVLWLADPGEAAAANLRAEAARRGVAPSRLHFAPRVPSMSAHLARLGAADLFLDTFHYNGHVTTSDALFAGLPVLTVTGDSYASRVSASLLRAVGLDELATRSVREFEALAVRLARDRESLRALRNRLEAARAASAAFDVASLARGLESLYERMVARHRAGLVPEHLDP
jgi:predicted O-linked N-acetylglucosamine transferase (SPINDLY family)